MNYNQNFLHDINQQLFPRDTAFSMAPEDGEMILMNPIGKPSIF